MIYRQYIFFQYLPWSYEHRGSRAAPRFGALACRIHGRDTLRASRYIEPRRIRQPTDFAPYLRRGDYKARRGGCLPAIVY